MRRSRLCAGLAALLAAAATSASAAAETHSVGTVGVTIPAESWERTTLVGDMGPDQFVRADRSYYMLVIEDFDLYETRADFEENMDLFSAGNPRLAELDRDPELTFTRAGAFTRATQRYSGDLGGLQLGYQMDLISAGDGVGYLFMSWSSLSDFDGLQEQLERTFSDLQLPGPDSEWAERATPTAHEYDFDGWTVELTFRDSVFPEEDAEPGERYSVYTGGGVAVHLFLEEIEDDADEVLRKIKQAAVDDVSYEELARTDVEIDAGSGRQVLMRSEETPPSDMAIAVVEVEDGRWLDLRMVSSDRTGHREELWNGLLRSLRVRPPDQVDAFPVVEESPAAEAGHIEPAARRLLEASLSLGSHSGEILAVRDGDRVLVRNNALLVLHPPSGAEDGSSEVVYESDQYIAGGIVAWGERTLLLEPDGAVSEVVDQRLEPAGFEADAVAPAGEELLIARNGRRDALLELAGLPTIGSAEIFLRRNDGEERRLLELPGENVVALAHRPDGEVLVAATPRRSFSSSSDGPAQRLLRVGAGGGPGREIARWHRVDRLEAAPDGWLVTGAPAAGRPGIFRLRDDGESELLLSGAQVGLALTEGELTFTAASCLEPAEEYFPRCVYRAGLDRVRELGPAFDPFSSEMLDRIGARVLPQPDGGCLAGFPATPEAIAAFRAEAEAAARELAGAELPRSGAGVDALLSNLYGDDLTEPAIVLLSVLVADTLLEEGAVWVPAAGTPPPVRARDLWEEENAFAVGLHPVSVVLSTLYQEDGWYTPAEEVVKRADGREVVLGLDPEAVRERARAAEVLGVEALVREGRTAQLAEVLAGRPENAHLRRTVYGLLAAHGHHAQIASLAEPFATGDEPRAADLAPWLAARLAGQPGPEKIDSQIDEVIADLRDAIAHAPDEAGLYLLLGTAYERTDSPDRAALARASYRKAQEVARWGSLATAAGEALERLADAE